MANKISHFGVAYSAGFVRTEMGVRSDNWAYALKAAGETLRATRLPVTVTAYYTDGTHRSRKLTPCARCHRHAIGTVCHDEPYH